eukprot:gene11963-12051_t
MMFMVHAQTNYKPGYLITLTGDSIRGFIDYREWDSNPSSITYKKTLISGSPEEKSSQNTSAFGIDGLEYFQLFTLPLSQAQVDLNKLATHPDTTTKVEAVFLKLLAKAQLINGSTGSSQQAGPKLSGSQWFAGLGVNNSELKLTQTAGTSTGNGTVNTAYSLFPTIRAGINFIPNVNTKRLLIRAEVSLTSNKYNITVYNTGSTQSALQVFASAGAAVNFSFYNQYQYITTYSSSFANYVQSNYPDLSKLWLSAMLMLAPMFALAQSNFKTGYVITSKGDTVKGFIDYREWASNPVSINFKTDLKDKKVRSFTTWDIRFFEISNMEAYQKYEGKISMDATDPDKITQGRDSSFRVATVFMKVIRKGKNVTLFSYTDPLKARYYIGESPDFSPVELIYRVYNNSDAETATHGKTIDENTYLKQLFALANKYNALDDNLSRLFERSNYSEPALLDIVDKINKVSRAELSKNKSLNPAVRLFITGAINVTNIAPTSVSPYANAGGTSHTSFGPSAGTGIILYTNPNTQRLQIRAGFTVSVGFGIMYHTYSNATFGPQNPKDSFDGTAENDPYNFNKLDNPFFGTVGVQFSKHWEVFVNYLSSTATTNGGYFQLSNTSEQIGINYTLGK